MANKDFHKRLFWAKVTKRDARRHSQPIVSKANGTRSRNRRHKSTPEILV